MDLQVVCPESSEFDGQAAYVALPATTGEMGVLPRHASEICTLRPGYVRISEQRMGTTDRVIAVDEGYAEITADRVIILTERAQDMAHVDRAEVNDRLSGLQNRLEACAPDDARRAYLLSEIAWCKLLLAYKG